MIVAGTGHRPQFCPCGFNENHPWLLDLKSSLVVELVAKEVTTVISGAAIGYDTWLAECALELNIDLHLYVPFEEQGATWPQKSRDKLNLLKNKAKEVKVINSYYSKNCFFKRDEEMIKNCEEVFSLLDPYKTSGGTYYTVKYAKKLGRPITNFWK